MNRAWDMKCINAYNNKQTTLTTSVSNPTHHYLLLNVDQVLAAETRREHLSTSDHINLMKQQLVHLQWCVNSCIDNWSAITSPLLQPGGRCHPRGFTHRGDGDAGARRDAHGAETSHRQEASHRRDSGWVHHKTSQIKHSRFSLMCDWQTSSHLVSGFCLIKNI